MSQQIAIGIDIGGTFIKTALVNQQGKILFFKKISTDAQKSKSEILKNINTAFEITNQEAKRKNIQINKIGLATPGFIQDNGKMSLISNIPAFERKNLILELKKKIKLEIYHENDANCFALAEHRFGAGKKYRNSIGIIWGTGIGAGIIIQDKIYHGYLGSAGEFGHTVINPLAPLKCNSCQKKGDIESFCSAPNLIKYYKYFGGKNRQADSIYIMNESDLIAKKVSQQCLQYLSIGLALLASTLNPEIITLGGGISKSDHYQKINKLTNQFVARGVEKTFKIVKHQISDDAGVIGAATLTFK